MTQTERKLWREITVVMVLKFLVLVALWFAFVRDQRVSVDAERVAAVVTSPASSEGEVHGQ